MFNKLKDLLKTIMEKYSRCEEIDGKSAKTSLSLGVRDKKNSFTN